MKLLALIVGGVSGSITNQCLLQLSESRAKCGSESFLMEPGVECCTEVNKLFYYGCLLNPLITELIGPELISHLKVTVSPWCGMFKDPFGLWWSESATKPAVETYFGGDCQWSDQQLEVDRFRLVKEFILRLNGWLLKRESCIPTDHLLEELVDLFSSEAILMDVGYGFGEFFNARDAINFLSLLHVDINKMVTITAIEIKPRHLTQDLLLAEVRVSSKEYPKADFEIMFRFSECWTAIKTLSVMGLSVLSDKPTALARVAGTAVQMSGSVQASSDICSVHEEYCSGTDRQFVGYLECMEFQLSLPRVSLACGNRAALSGNSKACRFKLHYLIPRNPEKYCPGIGPDSSGCSDKEGCGLLHVYYSNKIEFMLNPPPIEERTTGCIFK
jgi:hypothetical protein